MGPAVLVGVFLLGLYFLVLRPQWYSDITAPPGRWSVGGPSDLTLTVTKVEASPSRFRIWMTAKNESRDKLTLPIFGYFFVVDDAGRQYEADPFSSTFPEDVAPGATVSGYAEIKTPLPSDAKTLKAGFTTVFGRFGGSFTVKGIQLRR